MKPVHLDEGRGLAVLRHICIDGIAVIGIAGIAVLMEPAGGFQTHANEAALPSSTAPTGLTCQLLSRGAVTGVTGPTPKLGWVVPLSKHGDRQAAYQILAASSKELLVEGKADLWDSSKVESPESINVAYAGKP